MTFLEAERREYGGESFQVLYTGMRDGRVLEDLVDEEGEVGRDGGNERLYFTVSERQALNEYVFMRRIEDDFQPVVLETWFPEESNLTEWSSGLEYVVDSYDVENIRGYTDVETGEFVHHGEGWQPEGLFDAVKNKLDFQERPEYIFPEDTEFDPV